jgi:hypothetical protein
MARILQLSNAANWTEIYSANFSAIEITPKLHEPIPEVNIPVQLESAILAVYVTTVIPDGANWNFAGIINQRFQLGLTVGGTPEADSLARRKVWLNRIQLVIFPKLTTSYSCTFTFPDWFKTGTLTLWEYNGPDYESTDQLLQEIKSKVDTL